MIKPNVPPDASAESVPPNLPATNPPRMAYEDDLWKRRYNGLEAMMGQVDNALNQKFMGVEALGRVIEGFRLFAEGQYTYFRTQPPPPSYQRELALRITLNKLGEDLEVIERIACQRSASRTNATLAKRLALTDFLAYEAMRPVFGDLLPEGGTVLTYFQKSPEIRVIPYTNVALIGMPYSCLTENRDLLALPHEVGHYIYWNALNLKPSRFLGSDLRVADLLQWQLRKAFPMLSDYALAWTEEAFADCYGAWLAGAYLAKDSQDYEVEYAPTNLLRDDGEHPLPAIRPYSHIQMLRNQGQSGWADQLRTEWRDAVQAAFYCDPEMTQFTPQGGKQLVSLAEARDDGLLKMASVAQTWLDQIGPSRRALSFWQSIAPPPYADYAAARNASSNLYEDFSTKMVDLTKNGVPPAGAPNTEKFIWGEYRAALLLQDQSRVAQMTPDQQEAYKQNEWLVILEAGGWTTGPNDPKRTR